MIFKFSDKDGRNSLEVLATGSEKYMMMYAIEGQFESVIPLELHINEVENLIDVLKSELEKRQQ